LQTLIPNNFIAPITRPHTTALIQLFLLIHWELEECFAALEYFILEGARDGVVDDFV
jgi:hypothetical protein